MGELWLVAIDDRASDESYLRGWFWHIKLLAGLSHANALLLHHVDGLFQVLHVVALYFLDVPPGFSAMFCSEMFRLV
jgi:hypothetical protein